MRKSLIAGLVGLGLLASQAYASELKIGSWVALFALVQVWTIQKLEA
jgi:hypothetical protein